MMVSNWRFPADPSAKHHMIQISSPMLGHKQGSSRVESPRKGSSGHGNQQRASKHLDRDVEYHLGILSRVTRDAHIKIWYGK
jgi:hypothetical protein